MSDLISRKKAVQEVRELFSMGDCYCDELSIVGMLNGLPSIEPDSKSNKREYEKIIHCKECKFYTSMRRDLKTGICAIHSTNFGDDGFCSDAERI